MIAHENSAQTSKAQRSVCPSSDDIKDLMIKTKAKTTEFNTADIAKKTIILIHQGKFTIALRISLM